MENHYTIVDQETGKRLGSVKIGLYFTSSKPKNVSSWKILSYTIDYLSETDLVDITKPSRKNDGVKYLLTVIDTFSKYAWVRPLKSKSRSEIIKAFSTILEENHRKPQKLRSDQGTEFTNASLQQYLEKQNIHFYTAKNEPKSAIIERYNRTLKGKMYRHFTALNTLR